MGLDPLVVVLMGAITGVAGGVIRDILTAEIPMILTRGCSLSCAKPSAVSRTSRSSSLS
jgi:uncharacterized membrane protein YeiH